MRGERRTLQIERERERETGMKYLFLTSMGRETEKLDGPCCFWEFHGILFFILVHKNDNLK
jgi:hypothetical protein